MDFTCHQQDQQSKLVLQLTKLCVYLRILGVINKRYQNLRVIQVLWWYDADIDGKTSFAFCVLFEQKRDTIMVDSYFVVTQKFMFFIYWNEYSLPYNFEKVSSVSCGQVSVILLPPLYCLLVFCGCVSEDDSLHAVWGPDEKMILRGHSNRATAFWLCVAVEFSDQSHKSWEHP